MQNEIVLIWNLCAHFLCSPVALQKCQIQTKAQTALIEELKENLNNKEEIIQDMIS